MNITDWQKDGEKRKKLRALLADSILQEAFETVRGDLQPRVPKVVTLPGNSGQDVTTQVALLHMHTAGGFYALSKLESLVSAPATPPADLPQPWSHVEAEVIKKQRVAGGKK